MPGGWVIPGFSVGDRKELSVTLFFTAAPISESTSVRAFRLTGLWIEKNLRVSDRRSRPAKLCSDGFTAGGEGEKKREEKVQARGFLAKSKYYGGLKAD